MSSGGREVRVGVVDAVVDMVGGRQRRRRRDDDDGEECQKPQAPNIVKLSGWKLEPISALEKEKVIFERLKNI